MEDRKINKKKKLMTYGGVGLVLIILLLIIRSGGNKNNRNTSVLSNSNTSINAPLVTKEIKREFSFPLRNSKKEEVSTLKFSIETVEIRNEILVKGQRAQAVSGREFLIINLKVTNNFSNAIQLSTKDYVRLAVNGNENEWLAPDIHNDPVEVQADSTKYTRVGFPVNSTDKDFILRVGEINGSKETIKLEIR
ncbi:MAG: hypothetical protein US62_C0004G0020 [Candidatus Woesebacteria bacterium GW2011_GWA1_37_8]|uniref:DUF4352 domain-containing protein n=2 Tax=Candidatus Woeseibacteriota TaxID=1752722 RepID=A0A0G0L6I3_9BACT|nr:MAG: hypothetical protein US39_C0005G0004 [Microgenomates group bacterium GW2011_GWC1_37_12b]KKQ46207.1 MAG: hypothetical protein US62_C0004G0020 [Candidatus Woesebacteria bacterium GW2011_GWA1_37_8]KKQ87618.1 MAG: hypothetical protein UT10_C0003G0022 [Candidatus Woesebacteria bacterium GW2011_GWB1_38_8b]